MRFEPGNDIYSYMRHIFRPLQMGERYAFLLMYHLDSGPLPEANLGVKKV